MHRYCRAPAVILTASLLLASAAGCLLPSAAPAGQAAGALREVPVLRGSMSTTVSVDGHLEMPESSALAFGAAGNVKDVLVKEGDHVRAGAIMATLEDTNQVLDIKSANVAVQNVLSSLYEKVPRLPQFPGNYYDAISTTPVVNASAPVTTVTTMWLADVPAPPVPQPPTTVTTVTGRTSGSTTTTTITDVTTQITHGAGPVAGTVVVTKTVQTTTTTFSTTQTAPEGVVITPVYPGYYPNATSLASFNWAAGEIINSYHYLLSENYTAACSEMKVAAADLEAAARIIEDTIYNPQSGLGNTAPAVSDDNEMYLLITQDSPFAIHYVQVLRGLVDDIREAIGPVGDAGGLIAEGKYTEAAQAYGPLFDKINELGKSIITNYNVIKVRNDTKIYGQDICLYLYGAADEKLAAALSGIETGGLNSQELKDNLRIAEHYMQLCNGILGTNDYVLQHGLSLKNEQNYKISLAKSVVDLGNKRDDFLKTVIMAPFDGVVVSVGVKDNDVLSNIDYSSKTIQVVDTSQIKFTGTVDEIDILKIRNGQKAAVSIDAISGKTFPGHVSFISPYGAASTGGVVKFNITVLLDPTEMDLKGGLTASADVEIQTIEDALMLPISAVKMEKDGSYYVNVIDSATGQQEKIVVTTGIQNMQYIQITSGLSEGDRVIIEDRAAGAPVSTTFGPPGGGGPPR